MQYANTPVNIIAGKIPSTIHYTTTASKQRQEIFKRFQRKLLVF